MSLDAEQWLGEAERRYARALEATRLITGGDDWVLRNQDGSSLDAPLAVAASNIALTYALLKEAKKCSACTEAAG